MKLEHGDYFIIRRPLLPVEALDTLLARHRTLAPGDEASVLRELLADPKIAAAVCLSSPGFHERLQAYANGERRDESEGLEALATLMRFIVRMSTRATPFAAFASVGLGRFGPEASAAVTPGITCRLDIDCGVLTGIHEAIRRKLPLRGKLRMRRTPVFHTMEDQYRYMERLLGAGIYNFRLSTVAQTGYIDCVVAALARPATVDALVSALRAFDHELDAGDAEQFIADLHDSGLIEVDLHLSVTSESPLLRYLDDLAEAAPDSGDLPEVALLREIQAIMAAPCTPEQAQQRVVAVEGLLKSAGHAFAPGKAVQADSFADTDSPTLSADSFSALREAVDFLQRHFKASRDENLRKFADAFDHRFGEQLVPLMAALDPDTGIPFGFSSVPVPWVAGLGLNASSSNGNAESDRLLHSTLTHALQFKQPVIDLANIDLQASPDRSKFPADASAVVSLYGDVGQPEIALHFVNSPGAVNLTGRFAAREKRLEHALATTVAREDARDPDAIVAEIVHIPAPRAGNVLRRAPLRDYEIVLSGAAGVPHERQIQLDDLYLTVVDRQIVLWSRRLERRVVPRLSSAHNFFGKGNLGLYQFLCTLGQQAGTAASFNWPRSLQGAAFLPRVMYKSVVVSRARWRLSQSHASSLRRHISKREWEHFDALWDKLKLPRRVAVEDGDNLLEVDRDSELSLVMLADELSKPRAIVLVESPARVGKPMFHHDGRHWHAELVVPLHTALTPPPAPMAVPRFEAGFPTTGPRWTYYRIYGGEAYLDGLLNDQLYPMMQRAVAEGMIEAWFYVRYRDPDFHIRLRWLGTGPAMAAFTHRLVDGMLRPLRESYALSALVGDTYLPEYQRYGGAALLPRVEQVFYVDSEYCLDVRLAAQARNNDELLWKGALSGALDYMSAFYPDKEQHARFALAQRKAFASELSLGDAQLQQLGLLYRRHRKYVEACVADPQGAESELLTALGRRSRRASDDLARIAAAAHGNERDRLLASIIHMQNNRLFAGISRPQEFVVWDFLVRGFRSVAARSKLAA